ncbi:MAG: cardiolipin synthase [Bacteroidales bacterium]|nr:cardiolipin synthase [Bacteroidales bacterium]
MGGFILTDWLYYITLSVYMITILGTVIIVISENRNPVKSIAWVVVLIFLPVIGLIFYIFLGQDFRRHRMISKKSLKKIQKNSFKLKNSLSSYNLTASTEQQTALLFNLNQSELSTGNKVEIFTIGKDFFDSLINHIEKARHFIHIEFYIFQDDSLGNLFKNILIQKAKEGVEVRVIYDDVGCWSVKKKFFNEMIENGISVKPFLEVKLPALANKINYRNHRKIVVIDGKTGYIGGMNIADRYLDGLKWGKWRDTQIMIEGAAVQSLQKTFSVDWYFTARELLWDKKYFQSCKHEGNIDIQISTSGPIGEWQEIMLAIFKAVTNAKKYVYIQTPYFLPTEGLTLALQAAALANVDVRLMIPAHSDSKIVQVGSFSYIRSMLKAGVKVYFYKPGFLHAKMVAVDDELCTVGSANMDFRSFEHNFEANAFIYNKDIAIQLKNIFLKDQQECDRITLRYWKTRPIRQKAWESVIRLFSPLL